VLDEVLHTVNQASIGSVIHEFLDIVQSYHVSDIKVAPVLEDFSGRVKVHHLELPFVRISNFLDCVTKSRLNRVREIKLNLLFLNQRVQ
jgi:hypothetical protein